MSARPLCIDFGKKRIGVAATDYLGLAARPVEVVTATPRDAAADRIAEIAKERETTILVVGMPINMDGTAHDSEPDVRAFARRCEERTGLAVDYVDERLSTVEAERLMTEAGMRRKRRRDVVDMFAAVVILRDWMSRQA
jgi:putative Holliday junction resolvase